MTGRRIAAEAALMGRLAEVHARRDYQAGGDHFYRLTERLAAQGTLSEVSWALYRAAYRDLQATVGAPSVLCCE